MNACIDSNLPCVISTTSIDTLPYLGASSLPAGGTWNDSAQSVEVGFGTITLVNAADSILQFVSSDLRFPEPFFFIADHAYAVMRNGNNTPTTDTVTLRNPWNKNPVSANAFGGPLLTVNRFELSALAISAAQVLFV